ncbi:uncharacterized protein LOC143740323 [Siphateles boraxobius]|uniref:uncharacterized protein LOC143740323 n=1 Tax=Siphateles boraxobius TaxID=180520 RepID=UPI0040632736
MTMTEAATMIQPNLRRSTVASIIRTFRNENRIVTRPNSGGRGKILTDQQEQAVVDLVRARNDIRLTEIRQHILDNEDMFNNVGSISSPTIARILKRHQVSIKQLYHVPFERNADRVKQMRTEYVQRVMELDADDDHHKFIYLDEAGFNLAKTRRRGRNFIGPSKYLDNVGPTLPCVRLYQKMVWWDADLILDHIMQLSLSPFLMSSNRFVELKV